MQHHLDLLSEDLRIEQVLHPQADPHRPVGVGRADAAAGGAEAVLAEVALVQGIELLVVRQDQVRVARHLEPAAVDALGLEAIDLVEQHAGVDDHAVADDRHDVVVEHPARHELEGEGGAVDDERVPGVVATLVADDEPHLLREEIGDLPFALVTPLGADDDGGGHGGSAGEAGLRDLRNRGRSHRDLDRAQHLDGRDDRHRGGGRGGRRLLGHDGDRRGRRRGGGGDD